MCYPYDGNFNIGLLESAGRGDYFCSRQIGGGGFERFSSDGRGVARVFDDLKPEPSMILNYYYELLV